MIPDGWDEVRLGDLGYIFGGLTGKSAKDFGVGSATFVTFMNVMSNVVLSVEGVEVVDVRQGEAQNQLRARDVIFNGSSETPEEVGFGSTVPDELDGVYLNSFCFGFRCHPDAQFDSEFFAYLTRSPIGRGVIRPMAQGSTRYNIAKTNLLNGRFLLPPLAEQQAIAEALSDADGLVESLDALIAKKRDLKQAAMESLLARHGVEDFVSIDDVTERSAGFWGKSVRAPGDEEYGVIRAGDISSDGKLVGSAQRFLSLVEVERSEVHEGDVVITASGNGLGKTWCSSGESRFAASNFVRRLRPDTRRVVGKYLAYVLQSREGRKQLQIHTATTAYPNLMLTYFRESWLQLPEIESQLRTAQVLSDMDAEIDALVAKREKAELVKQGMMQELLSGRVRLV
jgi:type I restriction enzyme S subunit